MTDRRSDTPDTDDAGSADPDAVAPAIRQDPAPDAISSDAAVEDPQRGTRDDAPDPGLVEPVQPDPEAPAPDG